MLHGIMAKEWIVADRFGMLNSARMKASVERQKATDNAAYTGRATGIPVSGSVWLGRQHDDSEQVQNAFDSVGKTAHIAQNDIHCSDRQRNYGGTQNNPVHRDGTGFVSDEPIDPVIDSCSNHFPVSQ